MAGGLHCKASNSRGRSYVLMLLAAFGAALLGVMLLYKFRETRVCKLLLISRDQELHSFRSLFQRERDWSKELEKNNEDMKASLYLLRTQKMELDRRLLELQSTIYSLKEKQKIVNVALHHKQSEIKMLKEKELEKRNENSQLVDLKQSLKQKENELEDLRHRLESRGAVNADDPSDPREDNRGEGKSTDFSEQSTSKRDETKTHKAEERQKKQENLHDKGENAESKLDNDHKEAEVKESEAEEHQKADKILQSKVKMETETDKYGRTRKTRGKRWRYIAKNRAVDNGWRLISKKIKQENNRNLDDRIISTTDRKFVKEDNPEEEATKNITENESKMFKQEELNSKKSDTSGADANDKQIGNGEVGDGSIKQNPGEEMELTESKNEEKQEPERDEGSHFNRESNSEVVEDAGEEENKEEIEESEF